MKKNQQLILGKIYLNYGKYIGITKVYNYDGNIFKEHRFQTNEQTYGVYKIKSINIKDKETINKLLLNE